MIQLALDVGVSTYRYSSNLNYALLIGEMAYPSIGRNGPNSGSFDHYDDTSNKSNEDDYSEE
jgi:hypothetical protein